MDTIKYVLPVVTMPTWEKVQSFLRDFLNAPDGYITRIDPVGHIVDCGKIGTYRLHFCKTRGACGFPIIIEFEQV